MRLTFLGTGTSAGVPAIGCDCDVCTSTDPRDQRLRTSVALEFADPAAIHEDRRRVILIDAGPDLRQQALRARLSRCDAILFTHNHVDHTFGLDEVRRFNVLQHAPIDIYAERHTLDFLGRVYRHIFDKANNIQDSFVATLIAHEIEPDAPLDLYGVRLTPLRFLHGRQPVVGFRIERGDSRIPRRIGFGVPSELPDSSVATSPLASQSASPGPFPLAYCTDVSAVPTETWSKLRGLKTLVLDALRHRHHPTHLTLDQAIGIARQVGAEKTYFVHMAHDLPHQATQDMLPEGMFLAYDGLVLE